ncbi:MAG: hypothetical protein ABW184_09865 [Sphingobium sp.]
MRNVRPIDAMLESLREYNDDDVGYVELWRRHAASAGLGLSLHYARDGERHLWIGSACDAQIRHRSRWLHFLIQDLEKVEDRRRILMEALRRDRLCLDERPVDPRATTIAVREFLLNDGRILITPEGDVTEGGGVPRPFLNGTEHEAAECMRANRAYFSMRKHLRSDRQIKRVVRMLGRKTENGWWVLEARSH